MGFGFYRNFFLYELTLVCHFSNIGNVSNKERKGNKMNSKKINQAVINIVFVVLFIVGLIIPAAMIAIAWQYAGIASLLFLGGYWYMFNLYGAMSYK